jgi:hypothetical protein
LQAQQGVDWVKVWGVVPISLSTKVREMEKNLSGVAAYSRRCRLWTGGEGGDFVLRRVSTQHVWMSMNLR